jgi:hypothetical protein
MFKFKKTALALLITSPLFLVGCDDDDSSSSDMVEFSLGVSDAPVDNASKVIVCFSEITLKKSGVETVLELKTDVDSMYECLDDEGVPVADSLAINLLDAQGSQSIQISEGIDLEVGDYAMRVAIPDNSGSYVMSDTDGDEIEEQISVEVPSEELKFSKFTITQGGNADFTLEFDLRKSMNIPSKEGAAWHLKPNGVRLIDNNEAGHIAGTVSTSLLCMDENLSTMPTFVYLYEGADLDHDNLGDMHYSATTGAYLGEGAEPLASTEVMVEVQSDGSYEIGFVSIGQHTLALTCSADDAELTNEMIFTNAAELDVAKGNNELNFK